MSFVLCMSLDFERSVDEYVAAFHLRKSLSEPTAGATRLGKVGNAGYMLHTGSDFYMRGGEAWALEGEAFPRSGHMLSEDIENVPGEFCAVGVDERSATVKLLSSRTGGSPVYLFTDNRQLCASDDLRLLVDGLRSLGVQLSIDEEYVGLFLSSLAIDEVMPRLQPTIFAQVRGIPPGHYATASPERGVSVHRYWHYWQGDKVTGRQLAKDLRDSILEVVFDYSRRARAGVVLSGGIDSSCVAGALAAVSKGPIHLYNNRFRSIITLDESAYVDAVANHTHGIVTSIDSDDLWALKGVPDPSAPRQVEPTQGWFYLQEKAIAEASWRDGITYLMDGSGGDELFAPSLDGGTFLLGHQDCLDRVKYLRLVAELQAGRRSLEPLSRLVVRGHNTPPFLAPKLVKIARTAERLPQLLDAFAHLGLDALTAMRVFNLQCMNLGMGDRVWENREICGPLGMRRVQPLLDGRVVECVFRSHLSDLVHVGMCKPLLLRAMGGLLPQVLRDRKHKTTFEVLLRRGIGSEGREVDRIRELLNPGLVVEFGFIDKDGFKHYFENVYLQDRLDVTRYRWLKYWIWRVVLMELWLRSWVMDVDSKPTNVVKSGSLKR